MTISPHPESHRDGRIIFVKDGELFHVPNYSCKMAECIHKTKYMAGRVLKGILPLADEVGFTYLDSTQQLSVLRRRTQRKNGWYVSFNLDTGERPTLGRIDVMGKDPTVLPIITAITQMASPLSSALLVRINKPTTLTFESEWEYVAAVKENDAKEVNAALSELGIHNGKLTGPARYWSPEDIATNLAEVLEGSGIDPTNAW